MEIIDKIEKHKIYSREEVKRMTIERIKKYIPEETPSEKRKRARLLVI